MVKLRRLPSATVFGPIAVNTGATFTSLTVMVTISLVVAIPSVAENVTGKVPGPWSSAGVQTNS